MNKIINWVGGSFFRTIGRLLVYILLGYILALLLSEKNIKLPIFQVLDVHANTVRSEGIYSNFTNWTGIKAHNWSSSSSYSELTITNNGGYLRYLEEQNNYNEIDQRIDNVDLSISNVGSNGISISISSNETYLSNTYYTITAYYCTMNNVAATLSNIYIGGSWTPYDNNVSKNIITNTGINSPIFLDYTYNQYQYCRATSGYFSTSTAGNVIALKFTTSSTSGWFTFIGFKTTPVKPTNYLTESQLNSAIANSGLATASSISQVQSSINSMNSSIDQQTQQQQANHEETMDTITDDSINESGVSDFTSGLNKEYSSLTPFSDFLNLPLTWIQSLFASGQSCTTIHLPLPYLNNKNLDLPCMTQFWQQMGAIGTLVQVVWIAIVGVRIFNGLFLLTCETIDPNPDKDMTKLRTWEL